MNIINKNPKVNKKNNGRNGLFELRQKLRISQEEAAAALGYTQSKMSRIENGRYQLYLDEAKIIADYYGISLDELYKLLHNEKKSNIDDKLQEVIKSVQMIIELLKKILVFLEKLK